MQFIRPSSPKTVRLTKDLVRDIKRGHAWLFSHAIEHLDAPSGNIVKINDRSGKKQIASGIYDPEHAISVRIMRTQPPFDIDDEWLQRQLKNALDLRLSLFDQSTNGFRLVAGEGDGLPGLIIDVYGRTAVMKLDGGAPLSFYQPQAIAHWLAAHLGAERVILRSRQRGRAGEELLPAAIQRGSVPFLENGLRFSADVIRGQKTGFFLDQRDNRAIVRRFAKGRTVLNLFSYTGGFSVAAGVGQAHHVTSVDMAAPAMQAAGAHWTDNGLEAARHTAVVADCFDFLENAISQRQRWDMVICDPPSFAPNEKSRPQAAAAYERLAKLAADVVVPDGLLALASCSSHIQSAEFLDIQVAALGKARRKARLLAERGLPADHPTPIAMPELRYLKFLFLQLD